MSTDDQAAPAASLEAVPTPRTDAIDEQVGEWNAAEYYGSMRDLARTLEREAAVAVDIARKLSRLATMPGNPPERSIGTQVARLRELEAALPPELRA